MTTLTIHPGRKGLIAFLTAILVAVILAAAPVMAKDADVTVRPPDARDAIPEVKTLPEAFEGIAEGFRGAQARRGEITRNLEACRAAAAREASAEQAKLTCHVRAAKNAIEWRRAFKGELLGHAADLRALAERLRMEDAEVRRKIDGASVELVELEKAMALLRAAYRTNLAPLENRETLTPEEEKAFDAFARDVNLLGMKIDEVTVMRSDYGEQRDRYREYIGNLDTWSRGLDKFGNDLEIPIQRDAIYIRTAERRGAWTARIEGYGKASFAELGPMLSEIWRSVMSMPEDRPAGGAPSAAAGIGSFPEIPDSRAFLRDWAEKTAGVSQ